MAALIWLIVAIGLVVGEMLTVDLTLLMLAGGALAAAGVALATDNVVIQVAVFAVVSVLALGFIRPLVKKRMMHTTDDGRPLSVAAIEGAAAVVVEQVDSEHGLIEVQGDTWTARAFDATQSMKPGERVKVVQVKGATALVWKDI